MRVLLTGGAGFIGQHSAARLRAAGHDVVALDVLLPQVHPDPHAARAAFPGPVVVGDVSDEAVWSAVGSSADRPDAVLHLAAETGTAQSMYETDRYRRVNVGGTQLAGRFASSWDVPLVAVSSRAVYGEGRYSCPDHGDRIGDACCSSAVPVPSREDDEHQPVSFYGTTKSLAEQSLAEPARRVPVTVIRPQNVIGPGQALHNPYTGVLAAFLSMLREQRPLTVYGDGSQTRDFLHVDDLVATLVWALEHPADVGDPMVLNAGSGTRTTLLELAHQAAAGRPTEASTNGARPVEVQFVDVHRAGDITHACADLTRTAERGAPTPRWPTGAAVADFIQWSWSRPGAASSVWDRALEELESRGLTS